MSSVPVQRGARAESPKPAAEAADKKEEDKPDEKKSALPVSPKTIGIVLAVLVALFALKTFVGDKVDLKDLLGKGVAFVEAQGQTAVIWYCAFTFLGVVCLIPTTPMELAGGFLFSPKYGAFGVLAFTGSAKLCANIISVLIARFIVKDWVMKNVVAKSELLTMVSTAVKEEPWKMAFLVRGSMVPLFVKNYGLGVMDIGYLPIAVCSMIFTNFYAFQNIYMGSTLQDLKEVFAPKAAGGEQDWTSTAKKVMPIAFNVLLIVFLVKAVKSQMVKQKAAIEANLKKKENDKTK